MKSPFLSLAPAWVRAACWGHRPQPPQPSPPPLSTALLLHPAQTPLPRRLTSGTCFAPDSIFPRETKIASSDPPFPPHPIPRRAGQRTGGEGRTEGLYIIYYKIYGCVYTRVASGVPWGTQSWGAKRRAWTSPSPPPPSPGWAGGPIPSLCRSRVGPVAPPAPHRSTVAARRLLFALGRLQAAGGSAARGGADQPHSRGTWQPRPQRTRLRCAGAPLARGQAACRTRGGGADRAGVPQHVDPLAGSSPAPPPRPGDAVMEQHRPRGQNIPSCSRDNVSLLKHALAAQRHFFLLPLDATAGEIKGDGAPGGTRGGGCAKTTPGRFGSQSPAPPLRPQGKCRGRVGCCGGGSAPSPRAPETPRCEPHPLHCPPRGGRSAPRPRSRGGGDTSVGAAVVGWGRSAGGWDCFPPSARLGRGQQLPRG